MKRYLLTFLIVASCGTVLGAQMSPPKIIDAHVHHNGDPEFLRKLVARMNEADGMAVLLVERKDIGVVKTFVAQHPNRLMALGSVDLDDPNALELVDQFHAAGFRGLGELINPKYNFDDRRYWPIYERAEKYGMVLLFHTGIVNRENPDVPADVSVDRMRVTTLDLIVRRFPKLTVIAAHLGNPDYAWASEMARWHPNLFFDATGSTLIKKQEDYSFFKTIFWWTSIVSPHTPKSKTSAFEKLVFGSDIFNGELEEFDRSLERYQRMLDACGVSKESQANIFSGTMWRILNAK